VTSKNEFNPQVSWGQNAVGDRHATRGRWVALALRM